MGWLLIDVADCKQGSRGGEGGILSEVLSWGVIVSTGDVYVEGGG